MTPEGSPETDQLTLTFNEAADLPKTMLLFQPDAYLALFPYCQAILSSNKVLDKDDKIESIGMCVSAMIVAELDAIAASPGQEYRRQTAKATLQLVSSAAQKKNPYLIRESCAYVKDLRHPMGTSLKNERIYEIAQVLESRGSKLLVVTNEVYLQSKLSMIKLPWVNIIDFLTQYYWLTPTVNEHIIENLHTIGEEAMLRFAETIVTSIVWKGSIALMAPLPMNIRLSMFPPKPLDGVLHDIGLHRKNLQDRNAVFAEIINFQQVDKTKVLLNVFHATPTSLERTINFLAFLKEAISLCQPIANMFVNMTSRVYLLDIVSGALYDLVSPNPAKSSLATVSSESTFRDSTSAHSAESHSRSGLSQELSDLQSKPSE